MYEINKAWKDESALGGMLDACANIWGTWEESGYSKTQSQIDRDLQSNDRLRADISTATMAEINELRSSKHWQKIQNSILDM